jgi:hypothetical protein
MFETILTFIEGRKKQQIETMSHTYDTMLHSIVYHQHAALTRRLRIPIGGGAIESSIRLVINLRLENAGALSARFRSDGRFHRRSIDHFVA